MADRKFEHVDRFLDYTKYVVVRDNGTSYLITIYEEIKEVYWNFSLADCLDRVARGIWREVV